MSVRFVFRLAALDFDLGCAGDGGARSIITNASHPSPIVGLPPDGEGCRRSAAFTLDLTEEPKLAVIADSERVGLYARLSSLFLACSHPIRPGYSKATRQPAAIAGICRTKAYG